MLRSAAGMMFWLDEAGRSAADPRALLRALPLGVPAPSFPVLTNFSRLWFIPIFLFERDGVASGVAKQILQGCKRKWFGQHTGEAEL